MAPKTLGPKRTSPSGASARPEALTPLSATAGERANVCLRIRPALSEEEGQDNNALSCDRVNRLVWALADQEEGGGDTAPRQYAFDEVLEQHVGQAEVFDIVGMQAVQAALNGNVGCVLLFGASGAGKDFSLRCERPGQEGLLLRALSLIFSGTAALMAGMHAYRHALRHTHAHARTRTRTRTRTHVHTHTLIHAHAHTHAHIHTRTCARAHTHVRTHTLAGTPRTYTRTHTHTGRHASRSLTLISH